MLNILAVHGALADDASPIPVTAAERQLAEPCANGNLLDAQARVNSCTAIMAMPAFAHDAWPYLARAHGYDELGRADLALADLDIAISRADSTDPNFSAMYRLRCGEKAKLGSRSGAIVDCEKAISFKSDDVDSYEELGRLRFFDGQYDAALKAQNSAIALKPTEFALYVERSMTLVDLDRDAEAIHDLDAAIGLKPNDFDGYYLRGRAYMKTARYELAVADFDRTIQLNPEASFAFGESGVAQMHLGNNTKAISDLNEALKINPKLAPAYYVRGIVKRNAGDVSGGDADVALAKSMDPSIAEKIDQYRY